jgi:hypothetical protein
VGFFTILYCLSNKAKNVFSLFLHPHRLDYSYLPFISVFRSSRLQLLINELWPESMLYLHFTLVKGLFIHL